MALNLVIGRYIRSPSWSFMHRAFPILCISAYFLAAIVTPLGFALRAQQDLQFSCVDRCNCGCEASGQKCRCHTRGSVVSFTPCSTSTEYANICIAGLSFARVENVATSIGSPRQVVLAYPLFCDRVLPGFYNQVYHPPKTS